MTQVGVFEIGIGMLKGRAISTCGLGASHLLPRFGRGGDAAARTNGAIRRFARPPTATQGFRDHCARQGGQSDSRFYASRRGTTTLIRKRPSRPSARRFTAAFLEDDFAPGRALAVPTQSGC